MKQVSVGQFADIIVGDAKDELRPEGTFDDK